MTDAQSGEKTDRAANPESYPTGGLRPHLPLEETRAVRYPMLENGATMGTVCEYEKDGWTWIIITDLPDQTWGDVFDENDDRSDEKVVRFLILDELTDAEFCLFEDCIGCYEHVDTARMFKDHDGAGKFMRQSDFLEAFRPLGPFHPRSSRDGEYRAE